MIDDKQIFISDEDIRVIEKFSKDNDKHTIKHLINEDQNDD